MQVDITTGVGGERIGACTAENGFKTGDTASSGCCTCGQVDCDRTAIAAVIQRVGTTAASQGAGKGIATGELGGVIAARQIHRFKGTEAETIKGAFIGTGEDQGVAGFGGNQAVGVAASCEGLEPGDNAADGSGAASGGSAGVAGDATEGERNSRAIACIAEAVTGAAAQIEIAAEAAAIAHREGVVIAAQGDVLDTGDTTTDGGNRGERIGAVQGGTHGAAIAGVDQGVGACSEIQGTADASGRDRDGVGAGAAGDRAKGAAAVQGEGVGAVAQIKVAAQRATAVHRCRVATAAQGNVLHPGERHIAQSAATGAADREAIGGGIGAHTQRISAATAIKADRGAGSTVDREGIGAIKAIHRFKAGEGGRAATAAQRGAVTGSSHRDGLIGAIKVEGVATAGTTGEAGDTATVVDRGGVVAGAQIDRAAEGTGNRGRISAGISISAEIDRLETVHRQAGIQRGNATGGHVQGVGTALRIEAVAATATHQAHDAAHRAADPRRPTSSGGGGAIEAHRDGTAVTRIGQRVAAAAQIEIAAEAAAIAHREGVVIAAQGDVLDTGDTTTDGGNRGERIGAVQGGTHGAAIAGVDQGVGACSEIQGTADASGRDRDGVGAGAAGDRADRSRTAMESEGVVAVTEIEVAAQRAAAAHRGGVITAAQGDALHPGESDTAERATTGATDRQTGISAVGPSNTQRIGACAAIDRDRGAGGVVDREGIRTALTIDSFKTAEGGRTAAGSGRGACTGSGHRDAVIGPIEIEGIAAVTTRQAGDAAAVNDRCGVATVTQIHRAAEGTGDRGRIVTGTEIDRLKTAHRQAGIQRGGAVTSNRNRVGPAGGVEDVAAATAADQPLEA